MVRLSLSLSLVGARMLALTAVYEVSYSYDVTLPLVRAAVLCAIAASCCKQVALSFVFRHSVFQ